jgi:hypothetical protein
MVIVFHIDAAAAFDCAITDMDIAVHINSAAALTVTMSALLW